MHDQIKPAASGVRSRWGLWIGGVETPAREQATMQVFNPSNGRPLCEVARADAADVDRAVAAARVAHQGWADLPVARRRRILLDIADAMRERIDELAELECLNNGKPLREARHDVDRSAEGFEFYSGLADKLFGSTIPISPEFLNYTLREPIGVTAHFAPWNFPIRLAMRSVAPALAAGNAVVLKPADETPLTALRLGEIFAEAGLPAGVYNVITGVGPLAGAALAAQPGVNQISFTGSVATGIEVMRAAAANVVPVTLELGGKSPNIILADADLDAAIDGAVKAGFSNAGQVCCAGSRLLLHQSVREEVVARLVGRAARIRVGPGMDNPDMGPLISQRQRSRVLDYVELGRREGGTVRCGGTAPADAACQQGYFVAPTLIDGVANSARVAQEEIFGPVVTVHTFDRLEEAARLANESPYGLVAGIWTRDLDAAHTLAARIQPARFTSTTFSAVRWPARSADTSAAGSDANAASRRCRVIRRSRACACASRAPGRRSTRKARLA